MTLRELRLNNVAVFAAARLEPGPGFTVLSGESGAGKSICVSALRAALGARLDPDLVRAGAEAALVAAVFDAVPQPLRQRLSELGVPDDDLLTLAREVPRSGRGWCRVNGALVSQATLREVGDAVAEVTSQGASQRLLGSSRQRALLDAFGGPGLAAELAAVAAAVASWRAARAAAAAAEAAARSDAAAVERARELVADLGALQLSPAEEPELAAERLRLVHAARIAAAAGRIATAAGADEAGAADTLAAAIAQGAPAASIDPGLAALGDDAEALVAQLRDLALAARRHAAAVVLDEERLAAVEERLDQLARVRRRHGSIEVAITELERACEIVAAADGDGSGLERLQRVAEVAAGTAAGAVLRLRTARLTAARRLEAAATQELRRLDLPQARFRVTLGRRPDPGGLDLGDGVPVACGEAGVDDVEFRLATSRDMVPAPLREGPSGGELSRLALVLSALVADPGAGLLVLDEVDSGIGGETAARVGDALAAIGRQRQVVAVTHRPEIAARATHHVCVRKQLVGGSASAVAEPLAGEARPAEVARLMSGRVTRAALARARELLGEGAGAAPMDGAALSTM